ncbi:polysaccharide deacetylase family protein [Actinomadura macra]|uniref:polysaccharide deacetylase family protein n=1 Tax=Actinomadura macra TaxID=46164 RepID=UPI000A02BF53|nr:polysaccharide deacetylase family protein [Actinomadura macra]
MDGPGLVRRVVGGVLAVTVCGALSGFSGGAGRVRPAQVTGRPAVPVVTKIVKGATAPADGRVSWGQRVLQGVGAPGVVGPAGVSPARKAVVTRQRDLCARARCVALTFDDGPMGSTGRLLEILAEHRVRATFFLVGQNVVKDPEMVRREYAAGHEIANHSYTHADLGRAPEAKAVEEVTRTQDAIQQASGMTPVLLRPPYGSTGKRLTALARRMGMAQVLWAVDPLDWEDRDTKAVERRVMASVRPGDVVLMHDIHATTVAAVPRIIDRLAAKGYTFVTVTELFGGKLTPGGKYVQREP